MSLNYLQKTGIQALFIKENKRIAQRERFLRRPPFDFLTRKSIYEIASICFLNEYIWEESEAETRRIDEIINNLKSGHINDPKDIAYFIPVVACYRPLYKSEIWELALSKESDINHKKYSELMTYAIREPQEEEVLKKDIPTFGKIADKTSEKVKQQYEDNPYPRWIFKNKNLKPDIVAEDLEILVAGCGSGAVAIYAALEQPKCNITAFDLSLSSIAYAKRMSDKLGIKNIKFMNGDILNVKELNQEFDYIQCTGVLHHMKDPEKGWKELVSVLKTGGLMSIGLYSELARTPVRLVKNYISENDMSYSVENLKSVRKHIKTLRVDNPMLRIALIKDFFYLSGCRDLLFHEQEHNFSIPEIKNLLEKLNLEFLGFQENDHRVGKFNQTYTDPSQKVDLDLWHKFEQENPDTFISMYMFNCKKN